MRQLALAGSVWIMVVAIGIYLIVAGDANGKDRHRRDETFVSEPLSAADEQKAIALYSKTCAACHGQRLEGGVGPPLAGVGWRYSPRKIEKIAQRGKGRKKAVSMPAGLVSPDEARLLARWLATGPKPPVDAPASGKAQ